MIQCDIISADGDCKGFGKLQDNRTKQNNTDPNNQNDIIKSNKNSGKAVDAARKQDPNQTLLTLNLILLCLVSMIF